MKFNSWLFFLVFIGSFILAMCAERVTGEPIPRGYDSEFGWFTMADTHIIHQIINRKLRAQERIIARAQLVDMIDDELAEDPGNPELTRQRFEAEKRLDEAVLHQEDSEWQDLQDLELAERIKEIK